MVLILQMLSVQVNFFLSDLSWLSGTISNTGFIWLFIDQMISSKIANGILRNLWELDI